MDSSTEELLFDRLNLGEPRARRDLSFLDRQAGLDEGSAKPRRIEATATAVVRMESAEADTFLIDRMWRSINLRHTKSGNVTLLNHSLNDLVLPLLKTKLSDFRRSSGAIVSSQKTLPDINNFLRQSFNSNYARTSCINSFVFCS